MTDVFHLDAILFSLPLLFRLTAIPFTSPAFGTPQPPVNRWLYNRPNRTISRGALGKKNYPSGFP